jgi:predicted esterase
MRAMKKVLGLVASLIVSCSVVGPVFAEDDTEPTRLGSFTIETTPAAILGEESAARFAAIVQADELIEWEFTVPESYDPQDPPGLLVYISPSHSGYIPRGWGRLTTSKNLIWVAANKSSNQVQVARRITYALLAVGLADKHYEIDRDRIYLSGFSGGARVSGLLAPSYPSVFKGAIYMGGAEIWGPEEAPPNLAEMQNNRYAFLVGSEDGNRRNTLHVRDRYTEVGLTNTSLKIIQRMGHFLPEARHMVVALDYLDGIEE